MYVLNVSYSKSPDKVAPHIPTHGAWVKKYVDNGTFLFVAPKKSGLGGIIVVKSIPNAELKAILAEDSYTQHDVVDYQVADIEVKFVQPNLEILLDA
jgi:uncharacterized protein YciI